MTTSQATKPFEALADVDKKKIREMRFKILNDPSVPVSEAAAKLRAEEEKK